MKKISNCELLVKYVLALTKEVKGQNGNAKVSNDRHKYEKELIRRLEINEEEFYSIID